MMAIAPTDIELRTEERDWLVRYCYSLCRNVAAADDLAQETMLVDWQQGEHSPAGIARRAWLAGIARNLARRWSRAAWQESRRYSPLLDDEQMHPASESPEDIVTRDAWHTVLTDSLAILPTATREALLAHYVDDVPQATIATAMGTSEGTLAVRLHRARQTLRKVLVPTLADFCPDRCAQANWAATAFWCFLCGKHHLEGQFDTDHQTLRLRCASCGICMDHAVAVRGAKTYGAAINRINRWAADYYLPATDDGSACCFNCGRTAPLHVSIDDQGLPQLIVDCPCGATNTCGLLYLAVLAPEGQRFWRAHERVRPESYMTVETEHGPTDILTLASVTSADRLTLRYTSKTLRRLP